MFVDKIIVINLDRAIERKKRLLESFKRVGISDDDVLFLSAFDGNILDDFFDRSFFGKSMGRTFAKGELCCTLSHISAIKMAKSLNYESVLILEDDIELCDDFIQKMNDLENHLPSKWGQIYIGAIISEPGDSIGKNLYRIKYDSVLGTHSYILHNSVYDMVSNKLLEFNSSTDGEYNILHKNNIIDAYIHIPLLTYQYDGYSYITYGEKKMEHITKKYFIK